MGWRGGVGWFVCEKHTSFDLYLDVYCFVQNAHTSPALIFEMTTLHHWLPHLGYFEHIAGLLVNTGRFPPGQKTFPFHVGIERESPNFHIGIGIQDPGGLGDKVGRVSHNSNELYVIYLIVRSMYTMCSKKSVPKPLPKRRKFFGMAITQSLNFSRPSPEVSRKKNFSKEKNPRVPNLLGHRLGGSEHLSKTENSEEKWSFENAPTHFSKSFSHIF